MDKLTVIIPIHDFSDENVELLKKAIASVPEDINVLISTTSDVKKDKRFRKGVKYVTNANETSFCSLVNAAVDTLDDGWFSILEFRC